MSFLSCCKTILIATLAILAWSHEASAGFCAGVLKAAKGEAVASPFAETGPKTGGIGRVGRYDVYDVQALGQELQKVDLALKTILNALPEQVNRLEASFQDMVKPRMLMKAKWPDLSERAAVVNAIREARDTLMKIEHRVVENRNLTLIMADQVIDLREVSALFIEKNAKDAEALDALGDHEIDSATRYAKLKALIDEAQTLHINWDTQAYGIPVVAQQVAANQKIEAAFSEHLVPRLKAAIETADLWYRVTGNETYQQIFQNHRRSVAHLFEYARAVEDKKVELSVARGIEFVNRRVAGRSIEEALVD